MKRKSRCLLGLLSVLAVCHGTLAQAAELEGGTAPGWYLGGVFSGSRVELQLGSDAIRDQQVGGFAIAGGYHYSDFFGIEFELFASADFTDSRPELAAARYSSFNIAPRLTQSLSEHIDLFARFSLMSAVYEEEYRNAIPLVRGFERSWSGGGSGLGFGFEYRASPHWVASLGFDFNALTLKSDNLDLFTYIPDTEIRERRSRLGFSYRF